MWKEGCILINHCGYHYWIKQWDGILPSTVLSEGLSYIIDLTE